MLHQIIYYAIDMKTGLSSEVMRRKSGSPVKKAEYASVLMDRLMDSIKYVGDRRTYLSEGVAPLHMIDNIFRVILPHYGLDVALEEFKTLQARLNEIDEPLDSFDPKLFEEVIKGMTVNNRDEMTFRLIGDLTFTVNTMKKTRYIPYGYTMQNGTTVVEHSEAEVIRRIFESYINGNSLKDIADELTRLKVPYTEKTSVWDKARIARIIENAKYIGDREYAPIIDEEIYESAVQCKIARKTNQMRSDSETIRFLRDRVKCGECGYPMTRTLQSSCKIKERWTCTNPECGCRVRISDSVLIEKITMLINRIIENSALLEPGEEHRKKDTPPSIQHMTEEIMAEAASPAGSEQLILDRIREIAKERYRNSNIEKELALRIAKRQTEYMKAQNDFNRDYFQSLISYVTIGSDGTVGVRTKTDTTVKEDKQDG